MAVELRCPECRTKLRLSQAPEPDSEIECSKCGSVFPTDENLVRAGEADEDEKPKKKKSVEDNGKEEKAKNDPDGDAKKNKKKADVPFKRKKRRAKKRKTNPVVMWSIIGGAVILSSIAAGILIWMAGKKGATQEMMSYLPDDCDEVSGMNYGHMQKYPEFFKACENQFTGKGFKRAADIFAKAIGSKTDDVLDLVIQGEGKAGGKADGGPVESTVFRTKQEFDTSLLKNMPGAKEYSAEGVKYYTIDDIPELKYQDLRVFAPTNRIVVFCRGDMGEARFKAMLTGNKDNPDNTTFKRAGPLIKAVTRGTVWKFFLYDRSIPRPEAPPPPKDGREDPENDLKKEIAEICSASKGSGYKASVGSRDIRGEWAIWFKDSDAATTMAKKWKDKEWMKDDEKQPPRWWKIVAGKSGGGKTAENALKDALSFRSSGETFTIRTSLETKTLTPSLNTLVQAFFGGNRAGMPSPMGGPGGAGAPNGGGAPAPTIGPGGAGPGGAGPGGAAPMLPGSGTPPGKRRRFVIARRRGLPCWEDSCERKTPTVLQV
jgi:hypothetical protein